ncbi:MAG: Ribosomal RNA small subunit methyltransferase A [Chlamydiia bacterium]|nr:Ribosomal RNA small subunit methyltransferase A [Chlamydiia bacterium]
MTKFEPTKISSIKQVWEEEGFSFRKSLSQNFLIDQNIVDKILNAANVKNGDVILEIGPGSGALTLSMLKRGATVYAVEIDPISTRILTKHLSVYENFHLINQDILTTDLSFLTEGTKIISNLPYHITSPIIAKISAMHGIFNDIVLMVQKEMADRMLAVAPSKNRSSFSIFSEYYFDIKSLFIVKPGCFMPKPKVDSVIISLKSKENLPYNDPSDFFKMVRKAFSQKRKMISSTLKEQDIKKALASLGLDPNSRPEQLSLKSFIDLYDLLASS